MMPATLPLEKMSISDKISTMELLWDDICRNVPEFISPSWHGDILKKREESLKQGKDEFEDWEKAKKDIWNAIS
ncbi:MAG: addiction module protein [Desulfobacteraceae bacterium]|nr:addiction module protein [Desulfobacteraceae bacterium]